MSYFKTAIPIDIEAIKKLLPKDHTIERVAFDKDSNRLDLFWHTSAVSTPFTYATDFPVSDLSARKLPPGAKVVEPRTSASVPAQAVAPTPAAPEKDFEARAKSANAKARKKTE